MRSSPQLALVVVLLTLSPALAGSPVSNTRFGEARLTGSLPPEVIHPEGRSRWDFSGLEICARRDRTVEETAAGLRVTEGSSRILSAAYGGDDAIRWIFPERFRDDLRPGTRQTFDLVEAIGASEDRLRIDTEIVGIGWLHLASGPREVVLQRALVYAARGGSRGFVAESLIHRFVDPDAGIVAEISGPAAPNGRERSRIDRVAIFDATISSAATLKIHVSENSDPVLTTLFYGWDRGNGTAVSALDPAGYANINLLIAASTWNFSGNNTGAEFASTTTPITAAETCNFAQCGYTRPGAVLERSDKNFLDPNTLYKVNDVAETIATPTDVTVWLRAGAQNEGVSGSFGSGESRFCYTTVGTTTRTPVPLWKFTHQDTPGGEFYYQAADTWTHTPFNCEQNIFGSAICGGSGGQNLYIKACTAHPSTGTQHTEVIKGGVVTVPSGHTFNALLVRTTADFCVYLGAACGVLGKVQDVNTINYLWQVPHLGTVARIQSGTNVTDANNAFTTVAETNFQFGLFPPRSITLTGTTDTTASLSWDPGLDTHRITTYKVYWDTDSGSSSAYAFNSAANPGQATIVGTTATITGLTKGTNYFFTVTSVSDFKDPSTLVTTRYESLLYPTQISGDPSFVYPVEVMGATTCTTCTPTAEVMGVLATLPAGNFQLCWNAVSDPALVGHRILGSNTKQTDAGWTTVADVGLVNCWTGNPSQIYYLVVARGQGGTGPWGHYGH